MGNALQYMEEDQCIFKKYCNDSNKAWCNDFKLLEQSKSVCSIFLDIIKLSHDYLIEIKG